MNLATSAILAILLLGSCSAPIWGEVTTDPAPARGQGTWSRMPASPLSARYASHAVTIGAKLYVIGGTAAEPCPPNASCVESPDPFFSDGATFDPAVQKWTEIADAPVPIAFGSSAVVNGTLYLLVNGDASSHASVRPAFLSYDPDADRWEELVLPQQHRQRILASAGSRVVAFQQSQEDGVHGDLIYDPDSQEWSELPADPLAPSFDRWMVWSDEGLVLLGIEVVPQPGATKPAVYRAALLVEGRWHRFRDSEIIGYNPVWSWTGGKVLNASNESADGGESNHWGRRYYAGGTLDPSTGRWRSLLEPPQGPGEFVGVNATSSRYSVAGSGWIYDAHRGQWLNLTRPPGGPDAETSTSWVGDELYVWGGVRWQESRGVILDDGWVWRSDA